MTGTGRAYRDHPGQSTGSQPGELCSTSERIRIGIRSVGGSGAIFTGGTARSPHHPPLARTRTGPVTPPLHSLCDRRNAAVPRDHSATGRTGAIRRSGPFVVSMAVQPSSARGKSEHRQAIGAAGFRPLNPGSVNTPSAANGRRSARTSSCASEAPRSAIGYRSRSIVPAISGLMGSGVRTADASSPIVARHDTRLQDGGIRAAIPARNVENQVESITHPFGAYETNLSDQSIRRDSFA